MMLIEDPEASNAGAGAGTGTGTQPRVVPKRSLYAVVNYAYVFYQLKKEFAPCIQENAEDRTLASIIKLAERFSTHMKLVVPRKPRVVPKLPPAQMLRFTNDIPAKIFTNETVVLEIELVNIKSGQQCTRAPASPLKVEIFVTRGNLPSGDQKLRNCKPLHSRNKATMPLLVQATGRNTTRKGLSFRNNVVETLHNGRAVVSIKITDNSSWVKCKMFKLVARVVKGSYQGRRIKEALSEAFAVRESKLAGRRKADVPSPMDPTWRLINVGKEYEKRLQAIGINTVQDFKNKLESDPEGLKRTLDMQNMKWESTVEHARQCRVVTEEASVSNSRNRTHDSVTSNLGIQQGNMEDTNLIHMGMEQQRDCEACFGSDQMEHLHPIPSLNGNNRPSGAFEEMPEQPSTGQGLTVDDDSNWNQDCYVPHISIDDYISSEIPGLESCTPPNPMPEFQPKNMGMEKQVAPESNLAPDQMERVPSNTPFNENDEPNEILEGMSEHSTIKQNFGRLYSNQWKNYYPNGSVFFDGGSSHHFS